MLSCMLPFPSFCLLLLCSKAPISSPVLTNAYKECFDLLCQFDLRKLQTVTLQAVCLEGSLWVWGAKPQKHAPDCRVPGTGANQRLFHVRPCTAPKAWWGPRDTAAVPDCECTLAVLMYLMQCIIHCVNCAKHLLPVMKRKCYWAVLTVVCGCVCTRHEWEVARKMMCSLQGWNLLSGTIQIVCQPWFR
jgi:hypothetical protein